MRLVVVVIPCLFTCTLAFSSPRPAPHHCGCSDSSTPIPPPAPGIGDFKAPSTGAGSGSRDDRTRGAGTETTGRATLPGSADTAKTPPPYATDTEGWEMWWGFNRHPYLDLKRWLDDDGPESGAGDYFLGRGGRIVRRERGVSEEVLRDRVGPALQNAVETDADEAVRAASLVALAKLHPHYLPRGARSMHEFLAGYLNHHDHHVADAALVALGLVGDPDCAISLCEIASDGDLGRDLLREESIPRRVRARAALALGLVGARTPNPEVRTYIVHHLARILQTDETASADLGVACVTSLGLTPLDDAGQEVDETTPPSTCREAQVRFLCRLVADDGAREVVRAHVPRALGNLMRGVDDPLKEPAATVMLELLADGRRVDRLVQHGLVFGLGMLGDADGDEIDVAIRDALRGLVSDRNAYQKQISLVALALVSGRAGRGSARPYEGHEESLSHLLRQAARGKSRVKPWAALALGLQGHHAAEAGKAPSADAAVALRRQLAESRAPSHTAALSLALGLLGDREAAPLLAEKFASLNDDEARGTVAIGLGLLGATEAAPTLRETLAASVHRPSLLQDAAIALALLGDRHLQGSLLEIMRTNETCYVLSAAVNALGYVGDARAVEPLAEMLGDRGRSERTRRTAAVALGVVCEDTPYPWTDLYAVHLNYVAMTETLVSIEGRGILNWR